MKVLLTQKMAGISGSERYFLSILPELRKRDIDAQFLLIQHPRNTNKNIGFMRELQISKIPVTVINSRLSISPWLVWKIAHHIKSNGFDILQTNLIHADVWGACVKCVFLPSLKLLSVKHGYSEQYQTQHGLDPAYLKIDLMSMLTKWAGKYANRVISISSSLNNFLTEGKLISRTKGGTIPYGFDFKNITTDAVQGSLRFGRPQIVVAGRVVPVKQHHLLLKVLPKLIQEFPTLSVVMVGAGALLDDMKAMSDELGLSKYVRWEGFRSNMHDYIRDSDLMVIPSAAEGFGLVVLEAWHHSKPVVAFDVPAINEIIESDVDGILVKPFDTTQLIQQIGNILRSPEIQIKYGNAGKKKQIEQYGLNVMTDLTIAQMRDLK